MEVISRETAEFLLGLVYSVPMNAGQENFDVVLPLVLKARKELQALLAEH